MKPCIKEKQIEKIETIAEKNNDTIIGLVKDVSYIKTTVKEIKTNHLPHIRKEVTDLGKNYLVFKTKFIILWGLAITIASLLLNKIMERYL